MASYSKSFVDTSDKSHVKVFKCNGIFQPQNKYSTRRVNPVNTTIQKFRPGSMEYQVLTLPDNIQTMYQLNDQVRGQGLSQTSAGSSQTSSHRPSRLRKTPQRKHKPLRVTWSGVDKTRKIDGDDLFGNRDLDFNDEEDSILSRGTSAVQSRSDLQSRTDLLPSRSDILQSRSETLRSVHSAKSDPELLRRQYNRKKIQDIGLQWKLPPPSKPTVSHDPPPQPQRLANSANILCRSKNLTPVAKGLQKTGHSVERLRWDVSRGPQPSKLEVNREWQQKFEKIKGAPVFKPRSNTRHDFTSTMHKHATNKLNSPIKPRVPRQISFAIITA